MVAAMATRPAPVAAINAAGLKRIGFVLSDFAARGSTIRRTESANSARF
jgi:hypothetical protein